MKDGYSLNTEKAGNANMDENEFKQAFVTVAVKSNGLNFQMRITRI